MIWKYRASLIPSFTVLSALLLLYALSLVLGDLVKVKVCCEALPGLPESIDILALYEIASAGIWWLLSTYVFWVIAILCIMMCFFVIFRSLIDYRVSIKKFNIRFLFVLLLVLMALVGSYALKNSVVTAQDVMAHITLIASGSRNLVDLTYAIGLIAIIYVFITSGYILVPVKDEKDVIRRVKLLNLVLYTGSILIVVWLMQSRFLYHYSATLLIENHKELVQSIAPYLSLAIGGVASVLLLLMYLSSFVWLQSRYIEFNGSEAWSTSIFDHLNDEKGPSQLILSHWTRIVAVITPVLPGLVEALFDMSG